MIVDAMLERFHECGECDGCVYDNYCRDYTYEFRVVEGFLEPQIENFVKELSGRYPCASISFDAKDDAYSQRSSLHREVRVNFGGCFGPSSPDTPGMIPGTDLTIDIVRPFGGGAIWISVDHSGGIFLPRERLEEMVAEVEALNPLPRKR